MGERRYSEDLEGDSKSENAVPSPRVSRIAFVEVYIILHRPGR